MNQEPRGAPRGAVPFLEREECSSWSPPPRDATVCACAQTVLAIRSLLTSLVGRPQVGLFGRPIDTVRPPSAGKLARRTSTTFQRTALTTTTARPKEQTAIECDCLPSEKSNLTSKWNG